MNLRPVRQSGFTLIELMIVVAIIGVLASIAIAGYETFASRSKVSEVVLAAEPCRSLVVEYHHTMGVFPADMDAAGCTAHETQYVKTMTVTDGVIRVVAQNIRGTESGTAAYVLTPSEGASVGVVNWSCADSTIDKSLLPHYCR